MSKEKIDENFVNALKAVGKSAFNASKPALKDAASGIAKKAGKKLFRKAAKAGIKKFGKKGTRALLNTAKNVAKNKEVQDISKEAVKNATQWGADKLKKSFSKKQPIRTQEELVESFSKLVDKSLCNEAYGLALKAGLTGLKGIAKGTAKTVGKRGLKGLKTANKGKLISNIGSAIVDDVKDTALAAYDGSPLGLIGNTFMDEKGNWGFNPIRGIKKNIIGKVKTFDNFTLGGLGQMAYDAITNNSKDEEDKKAKVKKAKVKKANT
jgi:hypothetical protein